MDIKERIKIKIHSLTCLKNTIEQILTEKQIFLEEIDFIECLELKYKELDDYIKNLEKQLKDLELGEYIEEVIIKKIDNKEIDIRK